MGLARVKLTKPDFFYVSKSIAKKLRKEEYLMRKNEKRKLKNQKSQGLTVFLRYKFSVATPEKLARFYSVLEKFNKVWNLEMQKKEGKCDNLK